MNFNKSNELLNRVTDVIPVGSQTYSKSARYYPIGASPLFLTKGKGAYVWDVDGNKFCDFVCSLGPITLGYNYPAVDKAITRQLKNGIIFSLPSPLEYELTTLLMNYVSNCEMVRFMKTGSEACCAAIRLARAYTGKDVILTSGYHGWGSEFAILSERNKGIPREYSMSIAEFQYNNIQELERLFTHNKVAAVIMEPVIVQKPKDSFLHRVRNLCTKNNALLIFDEVVTGGRFKPLTTSGYFGVTPDLTILGKGIANGASLAAVCGPKSLMPEFENLMISGTFHGNCLDLAAGIATIHEIMSKDTIYHIWEVGKYIMDNLTIAGFDIEGYPCRPMIGLPDNSPECKTLFLEQMIQHGFLIINTMVLNICYSHSLGDAKRFVKAASESLEVLNEAIKAGTVSKMLKGRVINSAFKRI